MWDKMMSIDKRIIFAIVFIIVAFGLLNPIGIPIEVGRQAQRHYDFMESLPDGGILWVDPALSPGSIPELGPMMTATFHHAFRKDMRIVSFNMHWELGPALIQGIFEEVGPMYGKEYGVDFVNLGWQAGGAPVRLQGAVSNIAEVNPVCFQGRPISEHPLMSEVPRLGPEFVDHIVVFPSGNPGTEDYLAYVVEPTGVTISEGSLQMSIANALPFLDAGQYQSIIPGSRGAAEYELLLGEPGSAIAVQDVLSLAAVFITLLLIVGNVGHYMARKGR